MDSHEIIKHACDKHGTKQVASHLGVSLSLVYKWAQAQDRQPGAAAATRLTGSLSSSTAPGIQGSLNGYANRQEATLYAIRKAYEWR